MHSNITDNIIWKLINDPFFDQINHIVRWQGHKTLMKESVAQHTFSVTLYARVLAESIFPLEDFETKLRIADYALLHDFDEVITGDVGHSVKYNKTNGSRIREELKEFISVEIMEKFNNKKPEEKFFIINTIQNISPPVKKIVKLADWLSMVSFLLGEKTSGNKSIEKEFRYCIENTKKASEEALEAIQMFYAGEYNDEILLMLKNHDIV